MVAHKEFAAEAWRDAGFAVELAVKRLILHRERLNAWPSKEGRPDLYTHSLRKLVEIAGLDIREAPTAIQASWLVVLSWDRLHDYSAETMPPRVARDMFDAAFGPQGVIQWMARL